MNSKDGELFTRLLETFKLEAQEHLAAISSNLMALEEQANDQTGDDARMEVIYRAAHSLKGGARIVDLSLIEFLCQSLEECLAAVRRGELELKPALLDLWHETAEMIEKILSLPQPEAPATKVKSATMVLRQRLDETLDLPASGPVADSPAAESRPSQKEISSKEEPARLDKRTAQTDTDTLHSSITTFTERRVTVDTNTVRVAARHLDELMLQAEEMLTLKLSMRQQLIEVKEFIDKLVAVNRELSGTETLSRERLDEIADALTTLGKNLVRFKRDGEESYRMTAGMVDGLIRDAKSLLMHPFSSLTEAFPRMVRELSRELGKDVDLQIYGGEICLDRRILQELKDPLVHLIRNAVDHGIEPTIDRRALGKTAKGSVTLSAVSLDNGKVEISVRDDGSGVNVEQIIATAVRLGNITQAAAEQLSNEEAVPLIFRSGLSSRNEATSISGRGLGLAIVSERIGKLGGTVRFENALGKGTCFRLVIPLSLASFRGIQVRIGQGIFALPTLNVQKVCRIAEQEIETVGNRETFVQGERTIPIVSLANILGILPEDTAQSDFRTLLLLGAETELIAFVIDEVIGEDDLLIKDLGLQLIRVRNISGATVLGNGQVVPILASNDLLHAARGDQALRSPSPVAGQEVDKRVARRILVVDDSITSRTLLKNVLESFGYEVTTAVDGVAGLAALQDEDFDLVSTDVEMPNMDGFELTARIRSDERFSRLPVVLVTSVDSDEDKKKGINAGADAYIVKSSFDQTNLLDIIRKLT